MRRYLLIFCLCYCGLTTLAQVKEQKALPRFASIVGQYWSPDGQYFAFSGIKDDQQFLKVLTASAGKNVLNIKYSGFDPQFSADSRYMLLRNNEGVFELYSLKTGKAKILKDMNRIEFMQNGKGLLRFNHSKVLQLQYLDRNAVKTIAKPITDYIINENSIYYTVSDTISRTDKLYRYHLDSGKGSELYHSGGKISELFFYAGAQKLSFQEKLPGKAATISCFLKSDGSLLKIDRDSIKNLPQNVMPVLVGTEPGNLLLRYGLPKEQEVTNTTGPMSHIVWKSTDWSKSLNELSFSNKVKSVVDSQVLGIYDLHSNLFQPRFHYDGNGMNPQMLYPGLGRYVVFFDSAPYEGVLPVQRKDAYIWDMLTGEKQLLIKGFSNYNGKLNEINSFIAFSPDGSMLCYFYNHAFWCYDLLTKKRLNITAAVDDKFFDAKNDMLVTAPTPGVIVWAKDSKSVFLHSAVNVYRYDVATAKLEQLTDGLKTEMVYSLSPVCYGEGTISNIDDLVFYANGMYSGYSGWFRFLKGRLMPMTYEYGKLSYLKLAKNRDSYSYIFEKHDTPPQLILVSTKSGVKRKVFDANPDYKNLKPGKSELVEYTLKDGTKLNGALYYPFNYDPQKRYPMVVFVYERFSQNVHNFAMWWEDSRPNDQLNFTRNGYFVFMPDIRYKIDEPGFSATECVIAAVKSVVANKTIDPSRIGLMGHSWGGYETGFILGQTDLFKAGIAGAPVTDMTSMYLSLRWNTDQLASSFALFEHSQARFSAPYYDIPEAYIRNSTIHHVKTINTPLLIQIGNKDGIVDWTQGMELFNALRRLGKPATMLLYNNEGHHLSKPENMKDYTQKQMEYFDYYLKGTAKPDWL